MGRGQQCDTWENIEERDTFIEKENPLVSFIGIEREQKIKKRNEKERDQHRENLCNNKKKKNN